MPRGRWFRFGCAVSQRRVSEGYDRGNIAAKALSDATKNGTLEARTRLRQRGERIAVMAAEHVAPRVVQPDCVLQDDLSAMVCQLGAKYALTSGEMALLLLTMAEGSLVATLEANGRRNRELIREALIAMVNLVVDT